MLNPSEHFDSFQALSAPQRLRYWLVLGLMTLAALLAAGGLALLILVAGYAVLFGPAGMGQGLAVNLFLPYGLTVALLLGLQKKPDIRQQHLGRAAWIGGRRGLRRGLVAGLAFGAIWHVLNMLFVVHVYRLSLDYAVHPLVWAQAMLNGLAASLSYGLYNACTTVNAHLALRFVRR